MDAIDAIRTRRSIRQYRPDPVDRALLAELIRDAAHAPWTPISPPEPWVFNVIEGKARIAELGRRALDYVRLNRPARGYAWADRPGFLVFHDAPAVVIVSGRADNPVARDECTRAGQLLSLSAHARGLGACWVGAPDLWLREESVRAELGIPEDFLPHAVFTLGYPAAVPPPSSQLKPRIIWSPESPQE